MRNPKRLLIAVPVKPESGYFDALQEAFAPYTETVSELTKDGEHGQICMVVYDPRNIMTFVAGMLERYGYYLSEMRVIES